MGTISALPKTVSVNASLQNEDNQSWAILKEKPALFSLLTSVPVLAFSSTGSANIARRFRITADELESCIIAVLGENLKQSRPEWAVQDLAQVTKPAPELLETIRRAVTPTRPRRKAATKPKAAKKSKTSKEGRANA